MSQEIEQANSSKDNADNQPQQSDPKSVEVYRPKRWLPVLFVFGLLTVGIGGVWFILWTSQAFADPAARLTFIMGSMISLFLLLSTVATTCIYWGQRNIMLQQWKAMNENIARTDVIISKMGHQQAAMEWQAGIAEIETGLVDQQVGAMKEQLEAMRGQLDAMKEQADIMRETLAQNQKQIEMSETLERGYVGIGDVQINNLAAGNRPTVIIKWINGGRTPVQNFRANPKLVFGKEPTTTSLGRIDDDVSPISTTFFPVGAEREVPYEQTDLISEADFDAFEKGSLNIYIVGNFIYKDIYGKTRSGEISAMRDVFDEFVYETYEHTDADQSYHVVKPT